MNQIRTIRGSFSRALLVCAGAISLSLAGPVSADFIGSALSVQATNANGQTGTITVPIDMSNYDPATDVYQWDLTGPIDIMSSDGFTVLGTLADGALFYQQDPQVSLGFEVLAGATDTMFTIQSVFLTFAPINNAEGVASAGLTLTDMDGNGAELSGMGSGSEWYLAQYNGVVPGGTTFAAGFGSLSADPFSTNSDNMNTGMMAIGEPVASMSAQYSFMLSANDRASGTSQFTVIPAPGGLALLAVGFVVGRRRRRC